MDERPENPPDPERASLKLMSIPIALAKRGWGGGVALQCCKWSIWGGWELILDIEDKARL